LCATEPVAPETKRCAARSRGLQCKGTFPKSDERKTCVKCRSRSAKFAASKKGKVAKTRYNKTEKGKATQKRAFKKHQGTDKHKARQKRANAGEKRKVSRMKFRASDKGKLSMKQYAASDKRKAVIKRANGKRMSHLAKSLLKMVNGTHDRPVSFHKLGIFRDNADVEAFFESTKTEPWMKGAPWGKRLKDTLAKTVLQIGHRIPKVWYRHDDEDEIKKAWARQNLFAQCAVENTDANNRNILTRDQWMALKPIWPKQCATMTDENAWAWAANNVDNTTRKKERAAAKAAVAGPSNEAESDNDDYESDEEEDDASVKLAPSDDSDSDNNDNDSDEEDDASVKLAPSDDSESDNNDEECDEEACASIVFAPSDDDLD